MTTLQDFDLYLSGIGPRQYLAYVPGSDGARAAEYTFDLPTGTLKMREDLKRLEFYSLSSEYSKDNFHVHFGQMLYKSALGGGIGALFSSRLAQQREADQGLRLRVRVDQTAPELVNLPWELLHDGDDFLVTRTETPVSRLSAGIRYSAKRPLDRTLRMLVVVSSPIDLPGNMILNTEKEQEVILAALDKLQRKRLLDIDFCEEATLATIQDYMAERDYDILHFTGHGVFNEEKQRGELLLEDEQGNQHPVSNVEFAALMRNHPSLRLVVLSACQSARGANNTAYTDMASQLVMQGTSAVLAMQYSVLDEAATLFASRFYTGVANNKPLDIALTESRLALRLAGREKGGERIDFATPVLLLNDPACVNVSQVKAGSDDLHLETPLDFSTVSVMDTGFVGRHRELRRIRNGFVSGRHRAFIVHGLGGMGKSVLSTRVATKLHKSFRGVKAVRMTATTRPEDLLSELNAFLNVAGVDAFNKILHAKASLATKTSVLAQILTQFPLLIIFDNFEDALRAGQKELETSEIADPGLAEFFEVLVKSVAKGSRFIFTTRYDFDPARGRLAGEIDHIALGELPFATAVQCMNNHNVLEGLPVSSPRSVPRPVDGSLQGDTDEDSPRSSTSAPPITKHELYGRLGGHPYTIDVFARRASVTSVADVWLEIQGVEQEMIEFTLLDRTYGQLPPRAQTLLMRASILRESPSLEALQWIMGGTQASASVDAELKALLNWGMLSRQEAREGVVYPMHALVRDYAHRQLTASTEDETSLLRRAGQFWDMQAKSAEAADFAVTYALRARDYYFQANDFDKADQIVEAVRESLMQWGQVDLLLRLTSDSIKTRSGVPKAIAMSNLAMLYHELGDLKTALQIQEEVLTIFKAAGDVRRIPVVLHEIGIAYHAFGDFKRARANYAESLELSKTFADLSKAEKYNLAMNIYQLALLDMDEGKLDDAKPGLDDSLRLFRELPDARGVAMCLREIGQIHFARAEYLLSEKRVLESLDINRKINNKQGIGHCCALLGKVYFEQSRNDEAQTAFEKAVSIFDSMGMRTSTADCIYQLGKIHQSEGHYPECIEKCLVAMSIFEDTGNYNGRKVAVFLLQLRKELGQEKFDTITHRLGWIFDSSDGPEGMPIRFHRL